MASIIPTVRVASSRVGLRSARHAFRSLTTSNGLRNQGPGTGENRMQANDPLPRKETPNVSKTNETDLTAMGAKDEPLQEYANEAERQRTMQAPNRSKVWARNQQAREVAMSGPRFEQTIIETQPQPYAAIELIHQQPVRWVHGSSTSCDGGGGPLGHPKIFINVDKPQVCMCTYCGLPYASTHNRKFLESQPSTPYPLEPSNNPAQVQMPESPTMHGEIQGHYPALKGENLAEGEDKQPFAQR